jgi:thymidylate synthase (FAD)
VHGITNLKAEYIDHMGSDLRVVNAARVSFAKESEILSKGDINLIGFLARGCRTGEWDALIEEALGEYTEGGMEDILRHVRRMPDHWAPFAHPQITLRETVPIAIARQRFKHQIGLTYNEVSRRYVTYTPEVFIPEAWRQSAEDVKQGSSSQLVTDLSIVEAYRTATEAAVMAYDYMVEHGVCPEQARFVLPQGAQTTYLVTGSLYAFANSYTQRIDPHAQQEIQDLARQWDAILRPLFPHSWSALVD